MNNSKVYEYLTNGFSASLIAKKLGVSRQYISTIARKLENQGFVKCTNPNGNPKNYESTDKPFIQKSKLRRRRHINDVKTCRMHNISYKYSFVSIPKKNIDWGNSSPMKNNVIQYSLMDIIDGVGAVRFKRIKGKNNDILIVFIIDSVDLSVDQLPIYEDIVFSRCQFCANWFMKKYGCIVEPVGIYQRVHFAFLDTFEARELSKFGNFSVGGSCWVDCSTGVPEWETDKVEYALMYAQLPEILYKVMGENIVLRAENKTLKEADK